MDNFLPVVRNINHKYIVVEGKKMKKRISTFITAIILIIMTFALPAYADEITWQDNTENGRIEKNSTDEEQPAAENAGKRRLENL